MNVYHFASFIFVRKFRVEGSEISVLGSETNQHIIAGFRKHKTRQLIQEWLLNCWLLYICTNTTSAAFNSAYHVVQITYTLPCNIQIYNMGLS